MAWRLRSAARRDSSSRATPRCDAREVERRSRAAEPVPQQGFRIVRCPSSPLSEAGVTDLSPASADGWSGIHDGIIARSMRWSDAASHEPLAGLAESAGTWTAGGAQDRRRVPTLSASTAIAEAGLLGGSVGGRKFCFVAEQRWAHNGKIQLANETNDACCATIGSNTPRR